MKRRNIYKDKNVLGKMEKRKVVGLFLLSILMFSLVVGVVSATPADDFKAWSSGVLEGFRMGGSAEGGLFIKLLFTLIITLFVFTLLDTVGLFGNQSVLLIISLAVGILSTYYMAITQVEMLSNIYTAFGGTLITLLPFVILSAFMFRAVRDGNVQLMVLQHIAWGIFAVFLLYTMWAESYLVENFNLIFLVIFVMALVLTFANSYILNWLAGRINVASTLSANRRAGNIRRGANLLGGLGSNN